MKKAIAKKCGCIIYRATPFLQLAYQDQSSQEIVLEGGLIQTRCEAFHHSIPIEKRQERETCKEQSTLQTNINPPPTEKNPYKKSNVEGLRRPNSLMRSK